MKAPPSQPMGARVLIVDDEPAIRRVLKTMLRGRGFTVRTSATGQQALENHAKWHPDIVLLDLGLPDVDGTEVIRGIREVASTPIVVLSVRDSESDKVQALDLGADDYITKPFGVDELVARVSLGIRHAAHLPSGGPLCFEAGDLRVDLQSRQVLVGGRELHLTPTEYDLLMAFVRKPNMVLTDQMLLREVWGSEHAAEEQYLYVYMSRLRKKIHSGPNGWPLLETEPGIGYRLNTEYRREAQR